MERPVTQKFVPVGLINGKGIKLKSFKARLTRKRKFEEDKIFCCPKWNGIELKQIKVFCIGSDCHSVATVHCQPQDFLVDSRLAASCVFADLTPEVSVACDGEGEGLSPHLSEVSVHSKGARVRGRPNCFASVRSASVSWYGHEMSSGSRQKRRTIKAPSPGVGMIAGLILKKRVLRQPEHGPKRGYQQKKDCCSKSLQHVCVRYYQMMWERRYLWSGQRRSVQWKGRFTHLPLVLQPVIERFKRPQARPTKKGFGCSHRQRRVKIRGLS